MFIELFRFLINVLLFIEIMDVSKFHMHKVLRLGSGCTLLPHPHFKITPLVLTISTILWKKSEPLFWENFENSTPTFLKREREGCNYIYADSNFSFFFFFLWQCSFVSRYVFDLFSRVPFFKNFHYLSSFYFRHLLFYGNYILCSWK